MIKVMIAALISLMSFAPIMAQNIKGKIRANVILCVIYNGSLIIIQLFLQINRCICFATRAVKVSDSLMTAGSILISLYGLS